MTPRFRTLLFAGLAVLILIPLLPGCKALQLGKPRDLSQVEPDFIDPVWYDDYRADHSAAFDRFEEKVLQIEMQVTQIEKVYNGIEVSGITGSQDLYRASCTFPRDFADQLKGVGNGDYVTVKGLFSHMQETNRTYKLYLKDCVIVSK